MSLEVLTATTSMGAPKFGSKVGKVQSGVQLIPSQASPPSIMPLPQRGMITTSHSQTSKLQVSSKTTQSLSKAHSSPGAMILLQPAAISQLSDVHGLLSSQFIGVFWQKSSSQLSIVHSLPSSH